MNPHPSRQSKQFVFIREHYGKYSGKPIYKGSTIKYNKSEKKWKVYEPNGQLRHVNYLEYDALPFDDITELNTQPSQTKVDAGEIEKAIDILTTYLKAEPLDRWKYVHDIREARDTLKKVLTHFQSLTTALSDTWDAARRFDLYVGEDFKDRGIPNKEEWMRQFETPKEK